MNDFISNSKKTLITSAVYSGEREDGRDLFSFRNIQIQFSSDLNSAEVNLGKTKVVCNLEATITEPRPDKQNEGFLVIRVDMSALQSTFTHRQVWERSEEVSKVLEKTIKGSKLVNQSVGRRVIKHKTWKILLVNFTGTFADQFRWQLFRRVQFRGVGGFAEVQTSSGFGYREPVEGVHGNRKAAEAIHVEPNPSFVYLRSV